MKILLASEVILKGLDPTKPHKALDSSGRLAMSSNEPANSTASSFLLSPALEQLVEQEQVPVENSTDAQTSVPTLIPVEPVISEPVSEITANVTTNTHTDDSTLLELGNTATVPSPIKGKGKAVAKKAS